MSNHNYPIKPSLINAWSARLAEQVPFCPCPPETLSCAFKCDLDEVGGGILFPSSVSHEAHLVAFNNHHASNCHCPCDECFSNAEPVNFTCSTCSSSISSYVFHNNGSICNYCFNRSWGSSL